MIYYTVMIEKLVCAATPQCTSWDLIGNRCTHPKDKVMVCNGKMHDRPGPAMSTVTRVMTARRRMPDETGFAEVMVINVSSFTPYLSDDERAALRVGGTEAVRRMKKAKEADQRAQERAAARAAKKAAKPSKRSRRLDKALEAPHDEGMSI